MNIRGIYFITDRTYCDLAVADICAAVLEAGVRIIQYRDKERTRREVYEEAVRLRGLTRRFGATLIINDYADIAVAVDADGVHLGQDDLPLKEAKKIMGKRIVGISTHDVLQAKAAEADGADYIGFGPIFPTPTKDAGMPKGVDNIGVITQNVHVPVVAIGGINGENIRKVFEAGADAAAMASAICRGDVAQNAARFVRLFGSERS